MKGPFVSLVIPSYNGKELTIKLLESLKKTTYKNYEIVLVDNGSSDGTYEHVRTHYPYVKSVKIEKNRGFAGGMNFGIKKSKGDYIVVMNNDMTFDPKWLAELVKVAEDDKSIGILGSAYTEKNIDFVRLGYVECGKTLLNFKPIDIQKKNFRKLPPVTNVDNTFGLTRRTLLNKVGLFDEKFFIYWEEVDLCYRAKKAGYKIAVATKSTVFHGGSQTMKKYSFLKTFHYHKNKIRFIMKNLNAFRKFVNMTLILPQFLGESILFSFKGQFGNSYAVLKAIFWNIKNLKDYF